MVVSSLEEREIHPELLIALMRGIRKVTPSLSGRLGFILKITRIFREVIENSNCLFKLSKPRNLACYAIDSSFQMAPLSLVYGDLCLYTAGYLRYPRINSADSTLNRLLTAEIKIHERPITSREISIEAHILERKVACTLVNRLLEEEQTDINMVVIDGPILPLPIPLPQMRRSESLVNELICITKDLVDLCEESQIALVGVIKRVRSCILINYFYQDIESRLIRQDRALLRELRNSLNDKALALLTLSRDECIYLGAYYNDRLLQAIAWRKMRREEIDDFKRRAIFMNHAQMFIYRAPRAFQPTFVEVLNFSNVDTLEIVSWLAHHTGASGYPHFLDMIDSYVAFRSSVAEIVRRMLVREICRALNDPRVEQLLEHTDLQKKFTPRMG